VFTYVLSLRNRKETKGKQTADNSWMKGELCVKISRKSGNLVKEGGKKGGTSIAIMRKELS
jgi:hypothetical protein